MSSNSALQEAVRFHAHPDEAQWIEAALAVLREAVDAERRRYAPALLLLSGGGTPAPVYRALGRVLREEPAGLAGTTVSLVDERWVAASDAGSNERLLRETLLDDAGAALSFWPLADPALGLEGSAQQADARLRAAPGISLVLLGMGEDGHTSSLFPASPDLMPALASTQAYVAVDAGLSPGAGAWPRRIALTPAGWKPARRRLLLIRGAHKRALFERALRERDVEALPVCAAIAVGDAPLEVHWAP